MENKPDQIDREAAPAAAAGDDRSPSLRERESAAGARESAAGARESAAGARESAAGARESAAGARELELARREELARLRDEALRARAEADEARVERERLLLQMRDANEKLVVAALRADELLEEATAARRRAEDLAARLGDSEQALRAANRAKDDFFAMLGHELRNPLAPIMTALELMQLRAPEACARERTIIARQVTHLVRLIDDLLDISRITGGKIELHREPIELATVVSRAVETASPLLEKKSHDLVVDVAPNGLVVDGDPTRLVQIVSNLLTNAAKFTPPKATISVTGERRGSRISLRVRDTGIGISKEMLPRVFEPFAQERQQADRSEGGLGLGLAIVRSLVAMHGGTVTAHSEGIDRGSEFEIELPAATAELDPQRRPALSSGAAARPAARKILVVDDNRDAAELMQESLTALGHEVRVAFDGPSALAISEDFTPDVALLDIGLPVMDGHELAARLHALAPGTRFIAVTGYGQTVDRSRSREAGFSLHLVKPVDLATLQAGILQVTNDDVVST